MMTISFAWTTPALLAGVKTVTRRDWEPEYAARFKAGQLVAAYDRQPRYRGRQVAMIRLMQAPYRQSTAEAPESDWEAEGFAFLESVGAKVDGMRPKVLWRAWHVFPREMWVVRFELVEVIGSKAAVATPEPLPMDLALEAAT